MTNQPLKRSSYDHRYTGSQFPRQDCAAFAAIHRWVIRASCCLARRPVHPPSSSACPGQPERRRALGLGRRRQADHTLRRRGVVRRQGVNTLFCLGGKRSVDRHLQRGTVPLDDSRAPPLHPRRLSHSDHIAGATAVGGVAMKFSRRPRMIRHANRPGPYWKSAAFWRFPGSGGRSRRPRRRCGCAAGGLGGAEAREGVAGRADRCGLRGAGRCRRCR